MKFEKISLFKQRRDFLLFFIFLSVIFFYAIFIEFNNYKILTRFNSITVDATIVKQYKKVKFTKTGKKRVYQVLKLEADKGFTFYTTVSNSFPPSLEKIVKIKIYPRDLTFYQYLTRFYSYSYIIEIYLNNSFKYRLNQLIKKQHKDENISKIYEALYTATPLSKELQTKFSSFGISHLVAISGFHLGVISWIFFFLLRFPYILLQDRFFPYKNSNRELFFIVASILFIYMFFLDYPPSLVRAFGMLMVGFLLYDRGFEIISMQTLFVTIFILLAIIPKMFFSLGFWFSVTGVFYIFLFFIHFKNLNRYVEYILLGVFIYLMMLPFSLNIFSNFSVLHPFSIVWSLVFIIFYPFSIIFHLLGFGYVFDPFLSKLIYSQVDVKSIKLSDSYLCFHIFLSLVSIYKKEIIFLLLFESLSVLVYSIYVN